MALLGRIFIILFALWVATMAAGIVWSIGLLGSQRVARAREGQLSAIEQGRDQDHR